MYWHDTGPYTGKNFKPFKERGGCLLIWLIFLIGSSLLMGIWTLVGGPRHLMEQLDPSEVPDLPSWHWIYGATYDLLIVACGVAMWMWKRWGFYGYIVLTLISTLVALTIYGFESIFLAIASTAITLGIAWYVVNPYWNDFE